MRRTWIVLTLFAAAACSSADTEDLDEDRDGGVVVAERDGGTQLPPRDAGTEVPRDGGVPVDAGPARTLVDFTLLGDSPPDNLVMNPNLTSLSTVGPFMQLSSSTTRHFARTPTRQPVLELAPGDSAILLVQAEPGLTTATVWMGATAEVVQGEVLILGLARSQLDAVLQLFPTADGTQIGDINWVRFEGSTMLELIGSNLMFIENTTREPLFVTGPVVVARQGRIVGGIDAPKVTLAPAQRRKAEALLVKYRTAVLQDMKPVAPPRLRP